MLDDATDVNNRINKAAKSMGALKCAWNAKEAPIATKIKLCQAIQVSLALRGSENWSRNKDNSAMMEVLHHESISVIIGVTMGQAKEEEITN